MKEEEKKKVEEERQVIVSPLPGESHEEAVIRLYPEEYKAWGQDLLPMKEVEHLIQTRFRTTLMSKFTKAMTTYDLLKEGDKVAVAISGGKDSLLLAKLFQAFQRYSDFPFEVEFIGMDPGYVDSFRRLLEFNCAWLGIPIRIYRSDVFEVSHSLSKQSPCYLCARMRRGFLYGRAEELGCNKLALGHHFNDVIETTLLNVLWSGNYKIMMPKIVAKNFDKMELIRPLYLIEEENIIRWQKASGFLSLNCGCAVSQREEISSRAQIKQMIREMKKENPNVEKSIFRSGQNVAVDAILGWVDQGVHHNFLENYGDKNERSLD